MVTTLKKYLVDTIAELTAIQPEKRVEQRIDKFSAMGFYSEA
jgi:acetyl-CoA carboxylase carboxyl transferase subunit alpha